MQNVSILHRRFFDARAARGRDPIRAAALLDRSVVLGHSLDSTSGYPAESARISTTRFAP
jgi:hypothetical protein